ncbi:hypothetical protein ALC56_07066 [Trachymyrmex septentrionalis]|uniref:Uncharacterized protein n=1 Tax=Trachymyrmex septentrionalis TaxID=34720 RepID=A0A195FDV2_9HYME|nr:hypothetical protein ALC56_07066 [Trachymyrmex septentrionalis]
MTSNNHGKSPFTESVIPGRVDRGRTRKSAISRGVNLTPDTMRRYSPTGKRTITNVSRTRGFFLGWTSVERGERKRGREKEREREREREREGKRESSNVTRINAETAVALVTFQRAVVVNSVLKREHRTQQEMSEMRMNVQDIRVDDGTSQISGGLQKYFRYFILYSLVH